MTLRRRYELSQNGWKFLLIPKKGEKVVMTVVRKPIGSKCLSPIGLYNVICEAFKEIPEFVCETITYDEYTFKRDVTELQFYKEIAKPLKIKE